MLTNVHLIKAMAFPVFMYGCESWTIRLSAEEIDAFNLWVWRRLLSLLKKISPEYSLEGLMMKLKLQYFGHLIQSQLIGKDPNAVKSWRQENEMVG